MCQGSEYALSCETQRAMNAMEISCLAGPNSQRDGWKILDANLEDQLDVSAGW